MERKKNTLFQHLFFRYLHFSNTIHPYFLHFSNHHIYHTRPLLIRFFALRQADINNLS